MRREWRPGDDPFRVPVGREGPDGGDNDTNVLRSELIGNLSVSE